MERLHSERRLGEIEGDSINTNENSRFEKTKEEQALVERAVAGDREAFSALVIENQNIVEASLRAIVTGLSDEDVEDIISTTWLKALNNIDSFEPQAKFSTWLTQIAKNTALDRLRKKSNKDRIISGSANVPVHDSENSPELINVTADPKAFLPDEEYSSREGIHLLRKAINELPESLKKPLLMTMFEDKDYDTIAEELGITKQALKNRIHRARTEIKDKISKRENSH